MTSTLSVNMPNYNDGKNIARSIEAICNQSFPPAEVIIVDDGSTDNSVPIIQALMKKYPMIRLIQNEQNLGCIEAVRIALKHSTGDYVYSASANDLILPGMFERSMSVLQSYPEAPMCCGDVQIYDEATDSIKNILLNWSESPCYFDSTQVIELIRKSQLFYGISVIAKRKELLSIGGWRKELYWCCDFFAYSVLCLRGGACYVPQLSGRYTYHLNNRWGVDRQAAQANINKRIVELLKSSEFKDIAPAFARSRVITMQTGIEDYLIDHVGCWGLIAHDWQLAGHLAKKRAIREAISLAARVKNLCYRIYARLFHEYNKLRSALRKMPQLFQIVVAARRSDVYASGSNKFTEQQLIANFCWSSYFKSISWLYSYLFRLYSSDSNFTQTGVKIGKVDAEITEKLVSGYDRLQPIFYRESDHLPYYGWSNDGVEAAINQDHTFLRLPEQYLTLLHKALKQMSTEIQRCLGSPFTVVAVQAWKTEAKGQTSEMNNWHTDGFSKDVYKAILYVTGPSMEMGTTEIETRDGSKITVDGEPGTWVLFKNNKLLHRGLPPQGKNVRKIIQITLVPSFVQDDRPIDAGTSARYPLFPWDMLQKRDSIQLLPTMCRTGSDSMLTGDQRDEIAAVRR